MAPSGGWLPRAGGSRGSSSLSPRQKGKDKATASGEPAGDRGITTGTPQGAPALEGLPRGPGPRETRLTTFPSARFRRPHPVFSHVVPYAVSFYRRIKAGKRQASHRGAERAPGHATELHPGAPRVPTAPAPAGGSRARTATAVPRETAGHPAGLRPNFPGPRTSAASGFLGAQDRGKGRWPCSDSILQLRSVQRLLRPRQDGGLRCSRTQKPLSRALAHPALSWGSSPRTPRLGRHTPPCGPAALGGAPPSHGSGRPAGCLRA